MSSFDRRVRLRIRDPITTNDYGESVPGAIVVDEELWAIKRDLGSAEDILDSGAGTIVTAFDTFTIRYRSDVDTTPDTRITLTYEGRDYYIRRVRELGRKKFLEVEAGFITA